MKDHTSWMIHLRKEEETGSRRERNKGTSECFCSAEAFSPSLQKAQRKAPLFGEQAKHLEELEFTEPS